MFCQCRWPPESAITDFAFVCLSFLMNVEFVHLEVTLLLKCGAAGIADEGSFVLMNNTHMLVQVEPSGEPGRAEITGDDFRPGGG